MSIATDYNVRVLQGEVAQLKEEILQLRAALHHQANALQALVLQNPQKPQNGNRK